MNRAFLVFGVLIICGCHSKASVETYPFHFAPKGETKFFNECARTHRECRWLRIIQKRDGTGYESVDSYSFLASEKSEGVRIAASCSKVINLKAWSSAAVGEEFREFESKRISGPLGDVCELNVSGFDRVLNAKGFNYVRIVQERKAELGPIGINLVYKFRGDAKNKVLVQSGLGATLFTETNFANDGELGYAQLSAGNAGALDFESKPDEFLVLGISSRPDWSGMADIYHEKSGIRGGNSRAASDLERSLAEFSALGLRYAVDSENIGALPQLDYKEIVAKGVGDCKDLSVAMMRKLSENNIRTQPVLLGTSRGLATAPLLKNIPDLTWPSHVVVYLPDFDIFLDATLKPGKYVVSRNYPWYGAVGINLDTQQRVIIGGRR